MRVAPIDNFHARVRDGHFYFADTLKCGFGILNLAQIFCILLLRNFERVLCKLSYELVFIYEGRMRL